MFNLRYFADRFFPPRYFPKHGATLLPGKAIEYTLVHPYFVEAHEYNAFEISIEYPAYALLHTSPTFTAEFEYPVYTATRER